MDVEVNGEGKATVNGWGFQGRGDSEASSKTTEPKDARKTAKCNLLSRIFLFWLDPLFWTGSCKKGSLEHSDLYAHPGEADSEKLLNKFNRYWDHELERRRHGRSARLWVPIIKCLWWRSLLQAGAYIVELTVTTSQALILGLLVETLTKQDTQLSYVYAAALAMLVSALSMVHMAFFQIGKKITMMTRIICTGAIYQKVLGMNQVSLGRITTGHIVNLASNDVHRFEFTIPYVPHLLWLGPLHLAVTTYLIYNEVGWSAFLAAAFVLLQTPIQIIVGRIFAKLRLKSALLTDRRVKVMNEIICGIRVIKMYAWECAFEGVVSKLRKAECFIIFKTLAIRALQQTNITVSVTVLSFLIFSTYAATGGDIQPRSVFTILALLYILRTTIFYGFVSAVLDLSEANVAVTRIQKFLLEDEPTTQISGIRNPLSMTRDDGQFQDLYEDDKERGFSCDSVLMKPAEDRKPWLRMEGLSASWGGEEGKLTLCDISFEVNKEHPLLVVCGPVGSGKSSLLQCILRELNPLEGSVEVHGTISYASQEPWVFSGTLRENVLFGQPFRGVWYNTVIKACALDKDISLMEYGDQTQIGERGVTLSGGQKARVNLARAVYNQADIYLLDDPLSAVDTKVARHLFENVICGLLNDKAVVLVTHQVQFAEKASRIVALREGEVEAYGSHAELLSEGFDPADLLGLKNENDANTDEFAIRQDIDRDAEDGDSAAHLSSTYRTRLVPVTTSLETLSVYSAGSVVSLHFNCETEESLPDSEDKGHRKVSMKTYFGFFRAGGNYLVLLTVFLIFIAAQGSTIVADWWLSDWADCDRNNNGTERATCRLFTTERILAYAGITAFTIILNLARTICFYIICINASRVLHNRMFASLLRAPVRFFDTNPIGRVLNRFSKDQGFLDDLIPYLMCEGLLWVTYFVGVVLTTVISNVWMLIALVVLCAVILPLRWYFLKTSREVKRLESVARSPLYSHISTTIQGLTTIRAFGKQRVALSLFHKYHNEHTQGWWLFVLSGIWFSIRIGTAVAAFVAVVAVSSVPLSSSLNPTLVGLSLVYLLTLAKYLEYAVRVGAEAENLMVSAERIMEYGRLQSEPPLETIPPDKKPPPNWPDKGGIEVDEVCFRYADDLPLVLKSLSFSVHPSQKIGVVGRTGAGKSSLLSVLFRMAEYFGIVTIDGVNVKEIGLHDLRSRMSIIPQDPVLFSGTVRYNLDPFDEYSDQELWTVLEQVKLMLTVQDLDGHLHAEVSEGGANFSVGERQLVCLARALLRKNKILVLDEATANVDIQTDDIIQATLREHFSECTVLTIAHRLNTVMDSDKILVMSKGQVKEFDSPYTLLHNPRSQFRKMVELTGPSASNTLHQMAAEAHMRRHNTAYSTPTGQLASAKNEPWVMITPL